VSWSRSTGALVALILLAALVGTVDAAIGRSWDLVVVQGSIIVLAALLGLGAITGRTGLTLRRDLARWLTEIAADGAERPDDVLDRAVAAYRAGLTDTPPNGPGRDGGR